MKVMVVGFDGASPKLINEWIDVLPTFKTFKEEAIFSQTIPHPQKLNDQKEIKSIEI